jgi:hypothetical protein
VEPKETKISGADLITTQGVDTVETSGGIDFQTYGVGALDVLRIHNGPDAGDYPIKAVLTPFYQRIQLNKALTATYSDLQYSVFRSNVGGGVSLPLTRVESIDLLDSSGQPTGSKVPYAKPIDIRSRSFANVAHGIKKDLTDGMLGLLGNKLPSPIDLTGTTLLIYYVLTPTSVSATYSVTFPGVMTAQQIADHINTTLAQRIATVVFDVDAYRVAILPFCFWVRVVPGDPGNTAADPIFGSSASEFTTWDIRSPAISTAGGWGTITPAIDPNYDVVQVLDGLQIGFYDKLLFTNLIPGTLFSTGHGFQPEVGRHLQLGARSLGTARLYFLDPTTIEFDENTVFSLATTSGGTLNFLTDKTLSYQILPALPSDPFPKDGSSAPGHVFTSASGDFYRQGVLAGDTLTITFVPVTCTTVLADPVAGLVFQTLTLSVGGGVDKTIIFVNDSGAIPPTAVTRTGVANQINAAVGFKICSITTGNQLEFELDKDLIIRSTGTANATLGLNTVTDTNNTSPVAGTRNITSLTATTLTVDGASFIPTSTRNHFYISRPNLQRVVSTTMSSQLETAGLYYCDVELISEGAGDQYNIGPDLQMTATGYTSDGYYLTTVDPNLTFSTVEKPFLHVSRTILEVGVSDSPLNATQISGQNLQVNYERSSLTSSVQNFVSSEEERVICESALARHLVPYFIRFDATYVGGSKADVVTQDVTDFINALSPSAYFNVSDLEGLMKNRGALSVSNPIDLIAVIHNFDRSVTVERSQDKINTGRLAAFIPDVLNIVRSLA